VPEYPIPEQRPLLKPVELPAGRVLNMDDPNVTARFVRDIGEELHGTWRWTLQRPAVRIRVRTNHPVKYTIDLALPEVTFDETGPVTIAFTVNDHVLDRVRYTTPRKHHFEKLVPKDWMQSGEIAIVGAEIDKLWVSKEDGKSFGFIIEQIGLTR
jgi:hypothetical protein